MGKHISAKLVSEEGWEGIYEMLYLLSHPGMQESVKNGMQEPLEDVIPSLSGILWTIHFAFTARKDAKRSPNQGFKPMGVPFMRLFQNPC